MAPRKPPGTSRKKNQKTQSSPEWNAIKNFGTLAAGMAGVNLPTHDIVVLHPKSGPKARFWAKDEYDDVMKRHEAKFQEGLDEMDRAHIDWEDAPLRKEIGHLPGKVQSKKVQEWTRPYYERALKRFEEAKAIKGDAPHFIDGFPKDEQGLKPPQERIPNGPRPPRSSSPPDIEVPKETPKVPKAEPKAPEITSMPESEHYALEDSALPHRFGFMRYLPVALGVLGAGQIVQEYVKEKRAQKKLQSKPANR